MLCPSFDTPCGGVKQIYRHVDILNRNGFSAFVLHQQQGFRCTWFDNNTRIAYKSDFRERHWLATPARRLRNSLIAFLAKRTIHEEVRIERMDCLVLPEIAGPDAVDIEKGTAKVIFNQNAYLTFSGYSFGKEQLRTPYLNKDVMAVMVVSEDSRSYLKYVFPNLNLVRLHNGIDARFFHYSPIKKKQIAFMPRKLPDQVRNVVNMLKFRGLLKDFELIALENIPEREVARVLRESLIFLSFSTQEGLGLPPMEAMACGCIVIGYHGNGGKEYFKEEFCYPTREGDLMAFASKIEEVIRESEDDMDVLLQKGKRASEFILGTYSLEREEKEIVKAWQEILSLKNGMVIHGM